MKPAAGQHDGPEKRAIMNHPLTQQPLPKAFELTFRIREGHPAYSGKVHKMAFEAVSREYLLDSIEPIYEVISCEEIPHPKHHEPGAAFRKGDQVFVRED